VPSFTNTKDIIGGKIKKTGHVSMTTPIRGESVIPRLALDTIYLRTKFSNYRLSRSGDMIAFIDIENGSYNPDHAPFIGGWSSAS